jgi:hypothetical protein
MNETSAGPAAGHRWAACALAALACVLALADAGSAQADVAAPLTPTTTTTPPAASGVAATLEQCVTSVVQDERSATFSGEMTMIAGAAKMSMRIDVEEKVPGEAEFHMVSAPGLGVWRTADPKVKVYKYLKQVTNLSSPASYRGFVRFHWFNAKGHVIKRAERLTTRCLQPAAISEATTPNRETSVPSSTGPTSPTVAG